MKSILELWDYSDLPASESRLRQAAERAANHEERAFAFTQVARALGLQGRFEEGYELLTEVHRMLPEEGGIRAQYWLELGRLANSSGTVTAAMPHFQKAFDLAQAAGCGYAAGDAAHMLAIAAPPEEQVAYAERALEFLNSTGEGEAHSWRGPVLNNLGWSLIDLGRPAEAVAPFRQALEVRLAEGKPVPIRLAMYCLGCALRLAGNPLEGLAVLEEARQIPGSVGWIELEIGYCWADLGRGDEAKRVFGIAHALLSERTDMARTNPARLEEIRQLSTFSG